MNNFYTRHVVKRHTVIVVASLVFIIQRLIFLFGGGGELQTGGGFLWQEFSWFIPTAEISVVLSSICVILIAVYLSHINNALALIRNRSSLLIAFVLLLFSLSPRMMVMSHYYLGAIFFLLALHALLDSYQSHSSNRNAVQVGLYLAIGSLFVPDLILSLPLFLIGFSIMRSNSLRVFLGVVCSMTLVYLLLFSWFAFTNKVDSFLSIFSFELSDGFFVQSLFDMEMIILGVGGITLFTVIINYYLNDFKDKIRVRESNAIFYMFSVVFLFTFFLSPIHSISESVLYPLLITLSFIFAHFFATAESKWKAYFFYVFLAVLVTFSFILMLS